MDNLQQEKSAEFTYLQYLSILFSIIFSIAGIVFFLTGGKGLWYFNEQKSTTVQTGAVASDSQKREAEKIITTDAWLSSSWWDMIIDQTGSLETIYMSGTGSQYPGCDTQDIQLSNGQFWAACNVGAAKVYDWRAFTRCKDARWKPTDCTSTDVIYIGSLLSMPKEVNISRVCAEWYRIPNRSDWKKMSENLWNKPIPAGIGGLLLAHDIWITGDTTIVGNTESHSTDNGAKKILDTLRIPLAGYVDWSNNEFYAQGNVWHYWVASEDGKSIWDFLWLSKIQAFVYPNNMQSNRFSVRCIKNEWNDNQNIWISENSTEEPVNIKHVNKPSPKQITKEPVQYKNTNDVIVDKTSIWTWWINKKLPVIANKEKKIIIKNPVRYREKDGMNAYSYYRDNTLVYYNNTWLPYNGSEIPFADIKTFDVLNDFYAKDKNTAYLKGMVLDKGICLWICNFGNIDPVDTESFMVMSSGYGEYAKDKHYIYWYKAIVPWVDISSFQIIWSMYSWYYGKDKNSIYFQTEKIEWVDIKSFETMEGNGQSWYAKDKNAVYRFWQKIEWSDPISFRIIWDWYTKDKNHYYKDWKITTAR